jgi:hypothetical protein
MFSYKYSDVMGLSGIPMSLMKLLHKQGQDVDNDPDGLLIGQLSI